jgi:hypothetical protein
MADLRRSFLFSTILLAAGMPLGGTQNQPAAQDAGRYSDAEKAYVPVALTTKISEAPRRATLQIVFGRKFAATEGGPITITNPYMNTAQVFFTQMAGIVATADGGVIVGGRAGLDNAMHALGTGYWRIAPDGAITPLHTRSTNTYGKTPATKCEAPYSRTHLTPENFALAPDGRLVKANEYAIVKIGADGFVKRIAGEPFACEESGQASRVRGATDGSADSARFNKATKVLVDPKGNIWIVDQLGCSLRRLGTDGKVTTVTTVEQSCGKDIVREDQLGIDHLAWDSVHDELVTAWSRPVALPVHNLYTTVWRVKPTGEFRRVLYGTKVGKSPAKHLIDGISALAVDPQGRIHIASRIMRREGGSVLAVLRVDETGATVVPVTGAAVPYSEAEDQPRDGPAGRAQFRWIADMSYAPDGTLFLLDEHLIRKLDRAGQVTTWAF